MFRLCVFEVRVVGFVLEKRNSFRENGKNGSGYRVINHHQYSSWLNYIWEEPIKIRRQIKNW